MSLRYSPSTGGFYETELHGEAIPADAVYVAPSRHAELMKAQAGGFTIIAAPDTGNPVTQAPAQASLQEKQAQIAEQIKAEAERRASQLAPTRADLNELRRLIVDGASPTQAQLDRWALIDALETDAAQVEADMQTALDPYAFDYREPTRWTEIP